MVGFMGWMSNNYLGLLQCSLCQCQCSATLLLCGSILAAQLWALAYLTSLLL
jgi:hypothetical protein